MTVESFKIKSWKERERGLLISENDEWVLVKHIPVDFVIDGYKLYSKKFIKNRKRKSKEKKIERVLQLKQIDTAEPENFKFGNTLETLQWMEEQYGLFEFQDASEDEVFYGKINQIIGTNLVIDMVKANGKIMPDWYQFQLDEIQSLTFSTDYFESIRLLMADVLKKNDSTD